MLFTQDISAEQLLDMYSKMVYRLAFSRTQSKHDAEDITQEVFLKYIKSGKKFSDEEHRKAWLLKVTINTGKTLLTSAWFRHRTDIEHAENIGECMPEKGEVYYAVQKLPEKYRIVIHLFYYEELSIAQISKIINTKESTIKSQLHRGREMLKELLKEEQHEF